MGEEDLSQLMTLNLNMEEPSDNQVREGRDHALKNRRGYAGEIRFVSDEEEQRIDETILDSSNLFIGDLAVGVSEDDLMRLFSTAGKVVSVEVKRDKVTNINLGYGFVQMSNPTDAEKAKRKFEGRNVKGRQIRVGWAQKNTNLFVSDVGDLTTEELRYHFGKFGELVVEETYVKDSSYAFVRYRHRAHAERAKELLHGKKLKDSAVRIGWGNTSPKKSCVYFKFELEESKRVKERDIWDFFNNYGKVLGINLPKDGRGYKGYGFVHFPNNSDGEAAAMNVIDRFSVSSDGKPGKYSVATINGVKYFLNFGRKKSRDFPPMQSGDSYSNRRRGDRKGRRGGGGYSQAIHNPGYTQRKSQMRDQPRTQLPIYGVSGYADTSPGMPESGLQDLSHLQTQPRARLHYQGEGLQNGQQTDALPLIHFALVSTENGLQPVQIFPDQENTKGREFDIPRYRLVNTEGDSGDWPAVIQPPAPLKNIVTDNAPRDEISTKREQDIGLPTLGEEEISEKDELPVDTTGDRSHSELVIGTEEDVITSTVENRNAVIGGNLPSSMDQYRKTYSEDVENEILSIFLRGDQSDFDAGRRNFSPYISTGSDEELVGTGLQKGDNLFPSPGSSPPTQF